VQIARGSANLRITGGGVVEVSDKYVFSVGKYSPIHFQLKHFL